MKPVRLVLDVHLPNELIGGAQASLKTTIVQALAETLRAIPREALSAPKQVEQPAPPAVRSPESVSPIREQADNGGLIDMPAISKLLGLGERTVWRMLSAGAIPAPLRLGAKITRWRADEFREWIETGCPDQQTWEKIRDRRFQLWPPTSRRG
jgi:predicted DNA-binding transcriptional regulator AlpA